jgi:hypothetical protein
VFASSKQIHGIKKQPLFIKNNIIVVPWLGAPMVQKLQEAFFSFYGTKIALDFLN